MKLRPHILACAAALAPAAAQETPPAPGGERPRAAQRIVEVFDFEEQFTNPLDLPAGWVRAQHDPLVPRDRPGFPIFNRPALDFKSPAASGVGSVRAQVEGGSASLRLRPGVTPIFPMGKYLVRVKYRCERLVHARPRLVVRALDGEGVAIPGSERTVVAGRIDAEWDTMSLELPGKFPDAAYLQIDLEVVQPREFQPERLPGHQVWDQDFDAVVWFDDVVVAQVPQLNLETESPLGVFTRPDPPVLHARLRDLAAQDMTATIRVYDSRRRLVDQMERAISSGRVKWEWQPELPLLGWYRAIIEIRAGESIIATETRDFVCLDEPVHTRRVYSSGPAFQGADTNAGAAAWRPVGVELTAPPPGSPAQLGEAIGALGVRTATIPLWSRDVTAAAFPGTVDGLRDLLAALREAWVDPRLSLPVVPRELAYALRLTEADVLDALAADPADIDPYLAAAVDILGATTARWQFGRAGDDMAFRRDALADDMARLRGTLGRLVPGAELAVGWRLDLDPAAARQSGADVVRVQVPAWSANAPVGPVLDTWLAGDAPNAEFILQPVIDSRLRERQIAADLARRTATLWAAATAGGRDSAAFAIADPWRIEGGEEPVAHPTVAAAAWRNLADRLDGRTLACEWPMAPGVRCLVFAAPGDDPDRGGLIAVWREDAPADLARFRATLGPDPLTVYDIFGNAAAAEPASAGETGRLEHDIPLTDEPLFIEGVNTELARFLAGLTLDPELIESNTGEHHHAIGLANPWDVPAVGRLVIVSPGGYDPSTQARDRTWEITPRTLPFDLAPGEAVTLPLVLSFSRGIEAGPRPFVFDVELTADENYGWLRARTQARVGWEGMELDLHYQMPRPAEGGAVIVEATVTNSGEIARSLAATAYAPGQPRGRAAIGSLEPGQSVVRRFVFPDAAAALAGAHVLVSVSEADGPGRLTKGITLPGR